MSRIPRTRSGLVASIHPLPSTDPHLNDKPETLPMPDIENRREFSERLRHPDILTRLPEFLRIRRSLVVEGWIVLQDPARALGIA